MVGVSIRYANRSAWLNILVAKLFCGHVDREREGKTFIHNQNNSVISLITRTHLVWKD